MTAARFSIALLADLSADLCATGRGMRDSFLSVIERRRPELLAAGLAPQVTVDDYVGNASQALGKARERYQAGAAVIVGPCDSVAVHSLLTAEDIADCAVVSPLATGTALTSLGAQNFFRMTSPDRSRAEILVRSVVELYPGKTIFVYASKDCYWSYSQLLKNDLLAVLERRGISWQASDFVDSEPPSKLPSAKEPIVCCGPSVKVVRLIGKLRHSGVRSQVFTFGSNANLLTACMGNAVTVADVDPEDTNLAVRQEIERAAAEGTLGAGVSVSSLNCAAVLVNLLLRTAEQTRGAEVGELRKLIISDLRSWPQEGLLGRFAFSSDGEMIGPEQLAVLQVSRGLGNLRFRHLGSKRRKRVFPRISWQKLLLWLFGCLSAMVAAIQLIIWLAE